MEQHHDEQNSIQSNGNGLEEHPDDQQINNIQSSAAAAAASSNGSSSSDQDDDEEAGVVNYYRLFPPGYRFVPTDDEVIEYLLKKVNNQPEPAPNLIPEVDLYNNHPMNLTAEHKPITENVWYFFTPRNKKYPNGKRPNRAIPNNGYWKPTANERPIQNHGFRRTLDFLEGKHPEGFKTRWTMHEYRIKAPQTDNNSPKKAKTNHKSSNKDMKLDEWVLCKIYIKKREIKKGGSGNDEASTSVSSQPVINVSQNNIEASSTRKSIIFDRNIRSNYQRDFRARTNNFRFEDYHQPTVNHVSKQCSSSSNSTTGASLMGQTRNAIFHSDGNYVSSQNNEASFMAAGAYINAVVGGRTQINATRPTVLSDSQNNNEASFIAAGNYNNNASWRTVISASDQNTNQAYSMAAAGNYNNVVRNEYYQPTVSVSHQNIEASNLMAENPNFDSEYQAWNRHYYDHPGFNSYQSWINNNAILEPNVKGAVENDQNINNVGSPTGAGYMNNGINIEEYHHRGWSNTFEPIVDHESQNIVNELDSSLAGNNNNFMSYNYDENYLNVSQDPAALHQGPLMHEEAEAAAGTSQSPTDDHLQIEDDDDILNSLLKDTKHKTGGRRKPRV